MCQSKSKEFDFIELEKDEFPNQCWAHGGHFRLQRGYGLVWWKVAVPLRCFYICVNLFKRSPLTGGTGVSKADNSITSLEEYTPGVGYVR